MLGLRYNGEHLLCYKSPDQVVISDTLIMTAPSEDVLRTHRKTACCGQGGREMKGQRKDRITFRDITIKNWIPPPSSVSVSVTKPSVQAAREPCKKRDKRITVIIADVTLNACTTVNHFQQYLHTATHKYSN